jgi:hypothetical protein
MGELSSFHSYFSIILKKMQEVEMIYLESKFFCILVSLNKT